MPASCFRRIIMRSQNNKGYYAAYFSRKMKWNVIFANIFILAVVFFCFENVLAAYKINAALQSDLGCTSEELKEARGKR